MERSPAKILDNLTTAIVLVAPDLTVSYLNAAAEILLEVSGSRVLGTAIDSLLNEYSAGQTSLINSINSRQAFTQREAQLRVTNGQLITVDCSVSPLENDQSEIFLVLEMQPLDRLLRISREGAILASQQHSQALIRGLAHEIKNPLGGLRGAAQLLAKQLPDESLLDYTQIIIEEADRLSNLVNRLLGSSSLLDIQSLNIHEVLERVRSLVLAESGGKLTIARDYDPSIPELNGDQEQLIQALLNIVRNAMQALLTTGKNTSDDKPTITLKSRTLRQFTIGNVRHRLVCEIAISDNGPGIPSAIAETLFLPMVSGRAEGTGLGLSISQTIINHHQGLIECTSSPGSTTFSLYIPLPVPAPRRKPQS